ncbi:MAG TPA: hypothetical protein VF292_08320 [Rhodanobacteraceae bacterium]
MHTQEKIWELQNVLSKIVPRSEFVARKLADKIVGPHRGPNAIFYDAARTAISHEIRRQLDATGGFDPLAAAMPIRDANKRSDVIQQAAAVIAGEALRAYDRDQRSRSA